MTHLRQFLVREGACSEDIAWCNGKEIGEAWATFERPDWMFWLLRKDPRFGERGSAERAHLVRCAVEIASTALGDIRDEYTAAVTTACLQATWGHTFGGVDADEVASTRMAASAAAYADAADAASARRRLICDIIRAYYTPVLLDGTITAVPAGSKETP